jgi:hypothetical protein
MRCATCNDTSGNCSHLAGVMRSAEVKPHESYVRTPVQSADPNAGYVPGRREMDVKPGERVVTREVYGAKGDKGDPGPKGDRGPAGHDADPVEVVKVAEEYMLGWMDKSLKREVDAALKAMGDLRGPQGVAGSVGAPGRDCDETVVAALLQPVVKKMVSESVDAAVRSAVAALGNLRGPAGPAGRDSAVPGPAGVAGADARLVIGQVRAGDNASATIRFENGVHHLDLVLPKGDKGDSIVGERGPVGERGRPGSIDAAVANVRAELDAFKKEILERMAGR